MNHFNGKARVDCKICRPHAQPLVNESSVINCRNEVASISNNRRTSGGSFDRCGVKDVPELQARKSHGLNRYCSSGIFCLFTFFLLCATCLADPNSCVVKLNTNFRCSLNHHIMFVEHGMPISLMCDLDWKPRNLPYSRRWELDLEMILNNKSVEPSQITRHGHKSLRLNLGSQTPPSANTYECRLRLKGEQYKVLWHTQILIGFKPKEPRNFKCVTYDWETLVCTWEPVPNHIPTRFSLRLELPGVSKSGESMTSFPCPVPLEEHNLSPNSCRWNMSKEFPLHRHIDEYITLILDAENALGKESFTYKFNDWKHLIPSKPVNLSVVNKTSSSALLHWNVPSSMQDFPPGLYHRVSYRNQRDGEKTWHTIDIANETHATDVYFTLTNLEGGSVAYDVKVFLKSAVATGEENWSQSSDITFETLATPPPRTDVGSFEIVGDSDNRDVYIYWSTKSADLKDGSNVTYEVVGVDANGHNLNLQPDEVTASYAKFKGISSNSYRFHILVTYSKGANSHKIDVVIPSQVEMPEKPDVFTKVACGGGVYELSWDPTKDADVTNYTIFWCESDPDRPNQCSGNLNWVHVPRSKNMYNMTVPNPEKTYRFAIVENTPQASSGMTWFSNVTTASNVVGKIESVRLNRVDSDMIEVGWNLEYSGRIGMVEGFNLYYCSIESPSKLICKGPKMNATVKGDRYTTHGVLDGLEPSTTYMLTVAVLSKNGEGPQSDPLHFTTLEDLLSKSIRQVLSTLQNFVNEMRQENVELNRQLSVINSKIVDCVTPVASPGLNISELMAKLDSLSECRCQRQDTVQLIAN